VRWRLTALGGLPEEGEEVSVELGEVPVLSFPWNGSRLQGALHLEAWREDPENHRAYLVLPPGTLLFYNGLHSGAVAALEGRGRVRARVLDLSPAFRKGLRVAWRGGVPLALLSVPGEEVVEEAFSQVEWALFWGVAQALWERGREGPRR
jgi:hypothetical protein